MRFFPKLCAIAALATASTPAFADFTVRLTGATAFRNQSNSAILSMFGGEANVRIAHNGGNTKPTGLENLNNCTRAIFKGSYLSQQVTVKIVWTGSVGGLRSVADQTPLGALPDSVLPVGNGFTNAVTGASGTESPNLTADFAFSDVRQENTNANTSPALPEPTQVGVVPFTWMKNPTTHAGVTNMDGQKARLLFTNGYAPVSIWTGNPADSTTYVLVTGRNDDSGTRAEVLAETQYGVFNLVRQFYASALTKADTTADNPQNPVAGGAIQTLTLWPTSGYGVSLNTTEGNGGYNSSTRSANVITKTTASVTTAASSATLHPGVSAGSAGLVVYGDMTTWRTAFAGNASVQRLSYEGVSYDDSAADAPKVYNGTYTYWSYEQLYEKNGGLSGDLGTFRDDLVAAIQGNLGPLSAGLPTTSMNVARDTDGGLVGF